MLYLKCTQEVRKVAGLGAQLMPAGDDTDALLGSFYIHRFDLDRHKAFIFMSETTLLSFILLQGKRPMTSENLMLMFYAGLQQLLEMRGLSREQVSKALTGCQTGMYAKTNSRVDLSSLNRLVFHYQDRVDYDGGLAHCNLTEIIMAVNDMPQSRLGWATSWDALHRKLLPAKGLH